MKFDRSASELRNDYFKPTPLHFYAAFFIFPPSNWQFIYLAFNEPFAGAIPRGLVFGEALLLGDNGQSYIFPAFLASLHYIDNETGGIRPSSPGQEIIPYFDLVQVIVIDKVQY
jgi:hypothetical protein